jgi:hypothetical protein
MSRHHRRELHHLTETPRLGTTSRSHGSSTKNVSAAVDSIGGPAKLGAGCALRGKYNGGLLSETHKRGSNG